MSVIAFEEDVFSRGTKALASAFGSIDFVSVRFRFNFTDYYAKEMGSPLFRHFISFENLIAMSSLPDIKTATNGWEGRFATTTGERRLNVDPGYICLEHVILATTKGAPHRPYLRDGIYADLTLLYHDRSFHALDWTYPDYGQPETISLFNRLRKSYLEDLRKRQGDPW